MYFANKMPKKGADKTFIAYQTSKLIYCKTLLEHLRYIKKDFRKLKTIGSFGKLFKFVFVVSKEEYTDHRILDQKTFCLPKQKIGLSRTR